MKDDLLNIISTFPIREISLGYRTVYIFSTEELGEEQIGYSIDAEGQSLTGTNEGDWFENWWVIGYEDETGDPIIIDIAEKQSPVYTAVHGEGLWELNRIAESLESFILVLNYINELSVGRENPEALENNPVPSIEKELVIQKILDSNKNIDQEFWRSWLET